MMAMRCPGNDFICDSSALRSGWASSSSAKTPASRMRGFFRPSSRFFAGQFATPRRFVLPEIHRTYLRARFGGIGSFVASNG